MWNMLWPILAVSNTVYNICSKSPPKTVNGFASLSITYAVAVGVLFYGEALTLRKIGGIALCAVGLFLLAE